MKKIRNSIDAFCRRHPDFGIKNLMLYVSVGNVILWILSYINPVLLSYMTFSPGAILHGQLWRLVTFIVYPPSGGFLALIAFYFYYWIGSTLERYWGTAQFNVFFFTGAILTAVYGFIMYLIPGSVYTGGYFGITGEYLYLSMFFAFAALFPEMQVLLFYIIPIKMKYLALADAAFFLYGVLVTPLPAKLLPVVAMLNVLLFCGDDLLSALPRKPSKSTVDFRRESQRIRKEQQAKLYTHKCSVCGRTDTDYPNLEFRYCSRCAGYHCFCQDHINNHIHFTE